MIAPPMKRLYKMVLILTLLPASMLAQTEGDNGKTLGSFGATKPAEPNGMLLSDTLKLHANPQFTTPVMTKEASYGQHQDFMESQKAGGIGFMLWKGAFAGFTGTNYHLPGLMDTSSGAITLHQNLNRWHFTVSGEANKYSMPWQRTLFTQYGIGGSVAYDLSDAVSLHAFGSYYANKMLVGPAMSPYINTTTFGGYADIRFSDKFGANVGARRYMNPMTGKWTTEPIIDPYFKIGDSKITLPLGALLKTFVWGDHDNAMQFRPHPMSRPAGVR